MPYFPFMLLILVIVYIFPIRRLFYTWGATAEEVNANFPGDEIIPNAQGQTTRAITIHAPADKVWQWLVQIGQGRGGFYSYDWLENLFGLDIHTRYDIVPELQHLEVGDEIRLGKQGPVYLVAVLQAPHALILRMPDQKTLDYGDPNAPNYYDATWGFILKPLDANTCRLIIRGRGATNTLAGHLLNAVATHLSCIMEDRMMRGIKSLAERPAHVVHTGGV